MPMNRRQIGTNTIHQSNSEGAVRNVRFPPIADIQRSAKHAGMFLVIRKRAGWSQNVETKLS